jgi:type II secretory pathway pseudopilin PulG
MKVGRQPQGYTIVEVMVFLAVSGLMFVLAASFINGKQAQAEFVQSMNDANQQIQTIINQVSNGDYPSEDNFKCSADPSGGVPIIDTSVSNYQGTNQGCIFMGKVIQFGNTSSGAGYQVLTVAGRQYAPDGTRQTLVTKFSEAQPIAVTNPSLTQQKTLTWGSTFTSVTDLSHAGHPTCNLDTNAIGLFGGFGSYANSILQSGAQSVVVTCLHGSISLNSDVSHSQPIVTDTDVIANPNFRVCLQNGRHKASITIGSSNGQRLTTNLKMEDPVC